MLNNLRIATKFPLFLFLSAVICCALIGVISINVSKQTMAKSVEDKLLGSIEGRRITLADYLDAIQADLGFIAEQPHTIEALHEFTRAWDLLAARLEEAPAGYLQQFYIDDNPNPTGQKEALDYAADGSYYSQVHAKQHPWLRQHLRERGYYDIFLFDMRGNLVYTVFKELDYATNLNQGKYKDSDLGNAYRAATASNAKQGDKFFFDFQPYSPSAGAPASFISTPIVEDGKKVGVLVYQMPIDRLNKAMAVYQGLGETGEIYIVGKDKLMRNDARFAKESTILKVTVKSEGVDKAMANEHGSMLADEDGVKVFSAYAPIDFMGVRWALLSQQNYEEAMRDIYALERMIALLALGVTIAVGVIGFFVSRSITVPIGSVNDTLKGLAAGEDEEIAYTERGDEVGDLARSALVFKENAAEKRRLEEQQKLAEARNEQEKKDMMNQLADEFEGEVKGIAEMVAAASTELSLTARAVVDSVQRSARTSSEATAAAGETQSNVQSVASAAEELSASVKEIASQMTKSNHLVGESVDKTKQADSHALSLSEATQRVKEVITLISDIAGKINLLSLNATIESARAGEAGKGFAVVASEVKNLANQTDRSIEEIAKVIDEMNAASGDIISSLSQIQESIGSISESSGNVSSAVSEQSDVTNEIARNIQVAADGTSLISDNLQVVSSSFAEANESAEQILLASEELSQQAEQLNLKADGFIRKIRES